MSLFKAHPILAALLVLAVVGAVGGGAYAVAHTFLHIDHSLPADELQQSLQSQLSAQNPSASVTVTDPDPNDPEKRIIVISNPSGTPIEADSEDPTKNTMSYGIDPSVPEAQRIAVDIQCFTGVREFVATLGPGPLDDAFTAQLRPELAKCGLTRIRLEGSRHALKVLQIP